MKTAFALPLAVALTLAAVVAPAQQTTSFSDIASGSVAPPTLKIADLGAEFRAMRIHSSGEPSGGLMGSMSGLMMMASMGGGQGGNQMMPAFFALSGLSDLVWTKGQTVSLAGHEFLITYKLNTGFDPSSMSTSKPKLAASLNLSLVRTDTVISVSPEPTTPDQLRKILSSVGASSDVTPLRAEMSGEEITMAAIMFPVFAQARVAAKETLELSNAKQIGLAMLMYANDYDDVFPYVQSTDQLKPLTYPYLKSHDVWMDPNPNGGGLRFAMNLAGVNQARVENPAEAPLVYESNPWPDGKRVVTFADGHAKRVGPEEWKKLAAYLDRKYPRDAKKPIKGG